MNRQRSHVEHIAAHAVRLRMPRARVSQEPLEPLVQLPGDGAVTAQKPGLLTEGMGLSCLIARLRASWVLCLMERRRRANLAKRDGGSWLGLAFGVGRGVGWRGAGPRASSRSSSSLYAFNKRLSAMAAAGARRQASKTSLISCEVSNRPIFGRANFSEFDRDPRVARRVITGAISPVSISLVAAPSLSESQHRWASSRACETAPGRPAAAMTWWQLRRRQCRRCR